MVGDILSGKQVIKIETVIRRGVYAPLTFTGKVLVNGIVASNYVTLLHVEQPIMTTAVPTTSMMWDQHDLGHLLFGLQRIFCSYFVDTCHKEIYISGYGILAYLMVTGSSILNQFQNF
jgi:Hint module